MAGLADFAKGFFGYMLEERTSQEKAKQEAQEWERRQKILAALDVDTTKKKQGLERKDGDTFKDETGNWVTEQLDGGGNVVGTRPANPGEIASVEGTVAEAGARKLGLEFLPEKQRMEREGFNMNQRYMQHNMDISSGNLALRRQELEARNKGLEGSAAAGNPVAMIDSWLDSSEGKAALDAYDVDTVESYNYNLQTTNSGDPQKEKADPRDRFQKKVQLRRELVSFIRNLPPEQRPTTDAELRQLINQYISKDLSRGRERIPRN